MIKGLLKGILRFLLTPVRSSYQRRNGVLSTEERKEIPNNVLLTLARDMIREGHTATIFVKGYSMRPFLEHCRDRVILAQPRNLEVGDAVLAEIAPGHFVLHRIIERQGDALTLMGDGNIRGVEHCRVQDVAGIVTDYLRPKRSIKATDRKLCRRIRLWRRLLPVRRYLLVFYKAVV